MCEFCVKHGEGKKWYLNAKNYSADLLSDVRRKKLAKEFFHWVDKSYNTYFKIIKKTPLNAPLIGFLIKKIIKHSYINRHWGQVIPIEDAEKILLFTNAIVRVPCVCRKVATGKLIRSCFFISLNAGVLGMADLLDQSFFGGPDIAKFEKFNKTDTIRFMKEQEQKGAFHTIWTHGTPYTAAICNCDDSGCLALKMYKEITPNFFRSEYVIDIDKDRCVGCKECIKICIFDALVWDSAGKKVKSVHKKCYGCGICRAVCKKGALRLCDRSSVPEVASLW